MGKLVQQKSRLQKTKSTSEPQNQFVVLVQIREIYLNWYTVIVSMKFLFDFLILDNLDSTLLKQWKLILPSVNFSGLHDGLSLRTSLHRKKFTAICCAIHRNESNTGILNSGYLLSGTCRQKLSVQWHWPKFFLSRFFCISVSFISAADKFVANG